MDAYSAVMNIYHAEPRMLSIVDQLHAAQKLSQLHGEEGFDLRDLGGPLDARTLVLLIEKYRLIHEVSNTDGKYLFAVTDIDGVERALRDIETICFKYSCKL